MMTSMGHKGYSIIELIVVIGIIGSLLAIAAISGSSLLNKYRAESQIRMIYADFMNARTNAMQRNRSYFVTVSSTQYKIYEDRDAADLNSSDGDGKFQEASDRVVMQKDHGVYTMTWNNETTPIEFNTRGLMSGSERMGYVTKAYGGAYNCIKISSTRIRIGAMNGKNCDAQ